MNRGPANWRPGAAALVLVLSSACTPGSDTPERRPAPRPDAPAASPLLATPPPLGRAGLLAAVGERMRRCVREGDEVARMGGDEFTFLLPQIRGREDLASVAEKILRSFREPFALGTGDPVRVTPSIGGAVYPLDGGDLQELLKLADLAMYRTKERGRNGFTQAGDLPGGGKGMADRGGAGT